MIDPVVYVIVAIVIGLMLLGITWIGKKAVAKGNVIVKNWPAASCLNCLLTPMAYIYIPPWQYTIGQLE